MHRCRKMLGLGPVTDQFPGSSMVEHSAVNRRVASSNLARGANFSFFFNQLQTAISRPRFWRPSPTRFLYASQRSGKWPRAVRVVLGLEKSLELYKRTQS